MAFSSALRRLRKPGVTPCSMAWLPRDDWKLMGARGWCQTQLDMKNIAGPDEAHCATGVAHLGQSSAYGSRCSSTGELSRISVRNPVFSFPSCFAQKKGCGKGEYLNFH